MCKHIHAVCIFKMRSDSLSDLSFRNEITEEDSREGLYIEEHTTSKIHHEEEINDLIKEKNDDQNSEILNESIETRRKVSQRKKLL